MEDGSYEDVTLIVRLVDVLYPTDDTDSITLQVQHSSWGPCPDDTYLKRLTIAWLVQGYDLIGDQDCRFYIGSITHIAYEDQVKYLLSLNRSKSVDFYTIWHDLNRTRVKVR